MINLIKNSNLPIFNKKKKIFNVVGVNIKTNKLITSNIVLNETISDKTFKKMYVFVKIKKRNTFRTMSRGPIAKKKKSLIYFNKPKFFYKIYYFSSSPSSFFNYDIPFLLNNSSVYYSLKMYKCTSEFLLVF